MSRSAFALTLAIAIGAAPAAAFAQQPQPTPAAATTPAPAARAKWVAPIKGVATVQIIKSDSKRDLKAKEIVTNFKIKNTSAGAIALFRVDEYWYDNSPKPAQVSGDTQRWTKPFNPGEIIEITTRSPLKPNASRSQWTFTHVNGKIDPKMVKKFD